MIESSNGDNDGDEGVYREDDKERLKGLMMIVRSSRPTIVRRTRKD